MTAEAALLFAIVVWGLNYPVVKAVMQIMPPMVLNALRFVVSIVVLGVLYVYQRRRAGLALWQPLREHPIPIAALGILGFVFQQISFIVGLDHTTAINAALIMTSAPLWTAIICRALGTEHLSKASWFALIVVLVGTCVVVVGGSKDIHLGNDMLIGNLLILATAIFWGIHMASSKPVLTYISPTGLSFLSLMFALPFLVAAAIPFAGDTIWKNVHGIHWLAILLSGGLSSGLAVALWNNAIHYVGASNTAVYGNLVPVVALVFSYLLLGEEIDATQAAGGTLVMVGLLTMRRASRSA